MERSVVALFEDRVARLGDRTAFRALESGGAPEPRSWSWTEWREDARAFAAALIAAGHEPGMAVAVLADSSPVWPVTDLGTLMARGIGVGLYPTSAPAQVREVLADSGATVAVVDGAGQWAKLDEVRAELPSLRRVAGRGWRVAGRGSRGLELVGWEDWLARGRAALEGEVRGELEARIAAIEPDDIAILIYTSGSTGAAKGARIPHRYLLASSASIQETLGLTEADSSLSFLPYSHAAERVFGLYTRIRAGMTAGLVRDPGRVWDAAAELRPTVFGGLPRFYEKVYEALAAEYEATAGPERDRWDRTLELGRQLSRARRDGVSLPDEVDEEWREVGAPILASVRERFGGRMRLATSGGAALPIETAEFLDALGCTVLGAYGLTEHLCVAFNRPGRYAFDAVGPPMPGTELRFDDDGEILIRRGSLTFAGYHGRPEATEAAFTDDGEWLRTGDLGERDDRGFLRITGRKKELIALSTGKKVAPLPIEAALMAEPWIERAVLYGEGKKFVSALLTLRRGVVEAWARERGLDVARLAAHPEVRACVRAAVDRVNETVSRTESVREFVLLEEGLSAERGELTPTGKVRRSAVVERYRDRLDALYEAGEPVGETVS